MTSADLTTAVGMVAELERTRPLNERQLKVLGLVGGGDDLGDCASVQFRNSARALESRVLVSVSRSGSRWQAVITEAGRFYLEHGAHPEAGRASADAGTKFPLGGHCPMFSLAELPQVQTILESGIGGEGFTRTGERPRGRSPSLQNFGGYLAETWLAATGRRCTQLATKSQCFIRS